jgi:DNA-binding FadR family transcriptional regulator
VAATERQDREKPQQIADELRSMIVRGELSDGQMIGREPDLVDRFGVSRPSLREALRILEVEGLVTVVRGVRGGVVVHAPDRRMTARTAAVLLQARNVPLVDVYEARTLLEPVAVGVVANSRGHKAAAKKLRALLAEEEGAIEDPEKFGVANAAFHNGLVSLAGNQTLIVVADMLDEIVARAVTAVSSGDDIVGSLSVRQRGLRSQDRLIDLIEDGNGPGAENHWRTHMQVVGRVMLGQRASTVVDLLHHY